MFGPRSHSLCETLEEVACMGSHELFQGRQVGRDGLYMNDFWAQLLPWTQEKYNKAKYFVTGLALYTCAYCLRCTLSALIVVLGSEYHWANHPTAYGHAMNLSRKMRDEYDAVLANFDVIVMPTVMQPARRHVPVEAGPLAWFEASRSSTSI